MTFTILSRSRARVMRRCQAGSLGRERVFHVTKSGGTACVRGTDRVTTIVGYVEKKCAFVSIEKRVQVKMFAFKRKELLIKRMKYCHFVPYLI